MEPSQTTFIYSLWKFIDPPFQKPHRSPRLDPSYGVLVETLTDSSQKSYRSSMQRPYRNPLHRRTIDPLQRDFLETHYGSLIWSPYSKPVIYILIEALYIHETRQKLLVDPSYGALIESSIDSIQKLCRSSIQRPYRNP